MRVGIDLGTTNTVVSYIDENGIWKLLHFDQCGRSSEPAFLPSCVAVRNGSVIVGQPAVMHGMEYPDDFISDTKYDMGDPDKHYNVGGLSLNPGMCAEYILREVWHELSRKFPQERSFQAFVTVPARFGNEARQATKAALRAAGFETASECLTDEPIAAAIAYSTRLDKDKLVLVADIGGGTFDLSLLKTSIVGGAVHPDRLEPVAWDSDLHLGGNDVDELLLRLLTRKFIEDGGCDLYAPAGTVFARAEETRAAAILRAQTLQIKSQLYTEDMTMASVSLPDLLDGKSLDFTLTREVYMHEMRELTMRFSRCLQNVFAGSRYTAGDVDHVLVVGGMAHEICLCELLMRMFGRERLIVPEDPMFLVSKGAAVCNSNQRIHIENKAYSSIGILKKGRTAVVPIIEEGSPVRTGDVFRAELQPEQEGATTVSIELVEYRGRFDPRSCTTILRASVPLADSIPQSGFLHQLLRRPVLPRLKFDAVFTEDKLLQITVTQTDGTRHNLDVRLGGRNGSV